jgi:electron transport complex protein RnfC
MQITAKKGVKLFRDFYIDMDIKPYFIPKTLQLPIGFENQNIKYFKKIGDTVEKFEIIATVDGGIPVYSTASGKITNFHTKTLSEKYSPLILATIETVGSDKPTYPLWDIKENYTKEEIFHIIKSAAIINEVAQGYFIDFINPTTKYKKLIIDCVDEQPYDLTKTAVMLNCVKEVLNGAKILAKVLNIPKIELLIMNNFRTSEFIKNSFEDVEIIKVKGKYPAEPEIVQYVHENVGLRIGVNCAKAVYRATFFGEPQVTNFVTVWGEGVEKPSVCEVLNGTPIKYLLQECGAKGVLERVVSGGVILGYAASIENPMLRWDIALTAMPLKKHSKINECVNCGRCTDVCPMKLTPYFILRSSKRKSEQVAKQLTAGMCIYCGACSYICPSRQPLVQKIREYNNELSGGDVK